jgi:hypothetical protein
MAFSQAVWFKLCTKQNTNQCVQVCYSYETQNWVKKLEEALACNMVVNTSLYAVWSVKKEA